jgi:hypothetical protein
MSEEVMNKVVMGQAKNLLGISDENKSSVNWKEFNYPPF